MNSEQRLFAEALHDMLEHSYSWEKLAGMGVFELDAATAVVAFEELGHHAVPGPVVETVVAASLVALDGRSATIGTTYALDADEAELVLALDGNELWLAVPGDRIESVDETRRLFALQRRELLRSDVDAQAALDLGALLCAAQLLGLGRAMVEMAVDYAKTRVQFGCEIGSFQAVKHRLADAHLAVSFARPLVHAAAETLAPRDISAAKVRCADAAQLAARAALQVHGAIGFTMEYRLSRWLNKTTALIPAWGTRSEHRARILESLP
ncbi:acyl-CoA dehydrogenase family protein [Allorhizocola rhizosphaerae]|uniref:acyl-CoA dehydrogenase family protein n=1 Tax=Allorhizocola rhizosphaerae TaxID=1872709 RepID=UPI000E3BFEFB|nr:acyl-CoA dehydrogenase family protein [Allorhizocola rhizosphaerae]